MQFVDTNVLLYSISRDPGEAAKARRASAILAAGNVGLLYQVLQESPRQLTRATRQDAITHDQAVGLIEAWRRFPVQEYDRRCDDCRARDSQTLRHLLTGTPRSSRRAWLLAARSSSLRTSTFRRTTMACASRTRSSSHRRNARPLRGVRIGRQRRERVVVTNLLARRTRSRCMPRPSLSRSSVTAVETMRSRSSSHRSIFVTGSTRSATGCEQRPRCGPTAAGDRGYPGGAVVTQLDHRGLDASQQRVPPPPRTLAIPHERVLDDDRTVRRAICEYLAEDASTPGSLGGSKDEGVPDRICHSRLP